MLAEQSSEGTGSTGGIARSAKRKLNENLLFLFIIHQRKKYTIQ